MCNSLKLEGQDKFIPTNGGIVDSSFIVGAATDCKNYKMNGFARTDGAREKSKTMAEQWDSNHWKVGAIKASQFTEYEKSTGQTVIFNSSRLGCLINNKRQELRILTRPARTLQEVRIHLRMPSRVPKNMSLDDYVKALNKHTSGDYK